MKKIILLLFVFLISSGCAANQYKEPTYKDAADNLFVKSNYKATDDLLQSLAEPLSTSDPIVVATLVNIDELTASSRLGRLVSEQIGARLTQLGYRVIELKLRGDLYVKQTEGELFLSREIKDLVQQHKAQAVVVGTYSLAKDFVYINTKIVGMDRNIAIAAHDYLLPVDGNVRAMLSNRTR